jgi:hypothetical protein
MEKPRKISSLDLNADPNFESELARRRALCCLHDAGRILSDATSFFSSLDERKAITQIVGEIQTIERKLDGFAAFHREPTTLTNRKFDGFR